MKEKLLCCALLWSLLLTVAYAQSRRITGKVTSSEDGSPLAGVSVLAVGSQISTQTDGEGRYSISLPEGATALEFKFIGFASQRLTVGSGAVLDVVLVEEESILDEVVITGVAEATSRVKLPFALTKVDAELINTVPALDLSQTLRAKVAGVQISQTQGDDAATVFLRGAKSLFGNIAPLIVVDGFVTNLTLGDLNPQDVEGIEVVKGAAASALYGTRAEGGVIQVITKNGKSTAGGFKVIIDNEYGINNIQRYPDLATLHPYVPDPSDRFGFAYAGANTRILNYQNNGFSVNLSPYQVYHDNTKNLLSDNPFYRNSISLSTSGDKYNAYLSFENQFTGGGLLDVVDPNIRRAAKLNLQFRPLPKLEIDANIQYFYNEKPSEAISSNNQGSFFAATLQYEPFIDLSARNENGDFNVTPDGFGVQGSNLSNPMYEWSKRQYTNNTDDYLAGLKIRYKFFDKLGFETIGSINKTTNVLTDLYPVGYETINPSDGYNNGRMSMTNWEYSFINSQTQLSYNDKFGNFDFGATAKMVYEYNWDRNFNVLGYGFNVPLYNFNLTRPDDRTAGGSVFFRQKTVNYGYYLNLKTSYKDKFFIDALGRIDQSSRYGIDARTAFFPRIAAAYRITEDFDLGENLNELKARVSWGQAGSLPGYGYAESRASISNTGISISQNENTNLERAVTSEWELGIDAILWKKFNIQFNYAIARSEGDFVQPPSFTPYLGSTPVYQNFGIVSSHSIELEANGNVLRRKNFSWDAGLTFGRTRSMIDELGAGLPPFIDGLYRKEEGVSPFAFYGHKVLRSLSELEVVDGIVVNAADGSRPLSDFTVNDMGFVVLADNLGTANELPLLLQQGGSNQSVVIGDAQPDFQVGFTSTFTFWNRLSLFTTLDWRQGGQKYNRTIQYLSFDNRSRIWQDFAAAGLPLAFLQTAYNGNSYTDFWVEDNTYLALREIALSYAIPFASTIGWFKEARIGVTGRNLFTWTNFSGSNPEGASEYYPYPVYRTFTGKLTLTF